MLVNNRKSAHQKWYEQHRGELSEKRKKRYDEDAEYRERAVEASRRRRRGERTPSVPADAPIPFAEGAKRVGMGNSTLREWRRKQLFPEPKHHNGRLWFSEHQLPLLKKLKDFFIIHRMTPGKLQKELLKEVCASILANWN